MNIDVRKIDFEKDLLEIMAEYDDINTGAAAVKKAATGYLDYKRMYEKAARLLEDQERMYRNLIANVDGYFENQNELKNAVADYEKRGDISESKYLIDKMY